MRKKALIFTLIAGGILGTGVARTHGDETLLPTEKATSALMEETRDLMERGRIRQAVPYLEELLVRLEGYTDPRSLEVSAIVMYQLGIGYLETGQYGRAVEILTAFREQHPGSRSAETAALLVLEAYSRQDDPAPMEEWIAGMEEDGELERLFDTLRREQPDVYRNAVLRLASLYAETADLDRLQRFLPFFDQDALSDMEYNLSLLAGGDLAFEEGDLLTALALYRLVMQGEELKQAYDQRLAKLRGELDTPLPWVPVRQRETQAAQREEEQRRYERMVDVRRELESRSLDPELLLRMGGVYEPMERYRHAWFLFERIQNEYPHEEAADTARYSAFLMLIELDEYAEAEAAGMAYAELDPPGRYRDEVTLALVHLHVDAGEEERAETLGEELLAQAPEHRFADQISFLLASLAFDRGELDRARNRFEETATRWPARVYAEEAEYWIGMCDLLSGRFADAVQVFQGYLEDPEREVKAFADEATYRLSLAWYGLGDYGQSEETVLHFIDTYVESPLLSDAYSLAGDLRGAEGDLDTAIGFYEHARESAIDLEQLEYAVFQAARVLELQRNFAAIAERMEEYVERAGDDADLARAGLWLTKAWRALGQEERAAESVFATLAAAGNNPARVSIDELIELLLRDLRSDPESALSRAINERLGQVQPEVCADPRQVTLCLRLGLLALEAGTADERTAARDRLLRQEDLDLLSPLTLLRYAESSLEQGRIDEAGQAAEYFTGRFEQTEWMPDILAIRVEVWMDRGEYDRGMELADEGLARYGHLPQAGRLQKLSGDLLRRQGEYEAAAARYNEFLSVRQWRGAMTPEVLYWLGVLHKEQGRVEEAFAYFQRVYVLYDAYPEWVAKAYERSAECLLALGRDAEAVKTWREMAGHPVVSGMPEGQRAREQLQQINKESP